MTPTSTPCVSLAGSRHRANCRGFTLIELMVAAAIIAVLAALALPSYRDFVLRGVIPEATTMLAQARAAQERYFLDNRTYGANNACGTTMPADTKSFSFSCSIAAGADTYVITATGRTGTTGADFAFTIDQDGTQKTTGLPASWKSSVTLPVTRWITRRGG